MGSDKNVIIRLQDVTKSYRRGNEAVAAVDSISLDIRKGEFIAIVGPSGAGKTTLTHIIGGLLAPDDGEMIVGGKTIRKKNDKTLSEYRNRRVGFIFQNFSLIPHYSTIENITLPMIVAGMSPRERNHRADELLHTVGLGKKRDQRADKLSGGERQRVSIARALALNPDIIIADEPTGSLDSARGKEIMGMLMKLWQQGRTVLMVTHDTALAAQAKRVIHIHDGKIAKEQHARG